MLSIQQCAALWDLDGTLVDTAELHFSAWVRLCNENKRTFTRADFVVTFGKRNPEILEYLFGPSVEPGQVATLGEQKEIYYRAAARSGVALLAGARELLAALADNGVPQALATSAPRDNVNLILSITNTTEFFQAIVAMEDTTRGKPDPEVFVLAAQMLGVSPSRCVVFEDAVAGVEAAKAAGMKCVAVSAAGHHPTERLSKAGADLVVSSLQGFTADNLVSLLSVGSSR